MDAGGSHGGGAAAAGPSLFDEGDMPLMKETEHIPLIKEQLTQDKITRYTHTHTHTHPHTQTHVEEQKDHQV
jgi:hypothetical protein